MKNITKMTKDVAMPAIIPLSIYFFVIGRQTGSAYTITIVESNQPTIDKTSLINPLLSAIRAEITTIIKIAMSILFKLYIFLPNQTETVHVTNCEPF